MNLSGLRSTTALAVMMAALAGGQAFAQAQATRDGPAEARRFSLPTEPLPDSLKQISARFGVPIDYDPAGLRHYQASPVVDAKTAAGAVQQALAGTDLTLTRSVDGSKLGVGRPDPNARVAEVVVTAPRNQAEVAYKADTSDTSTRSGVPNKDLPASISIVTAQVLKDEQAQTVDDAVRNVASVNTVLSNVQGAQTYEIRGFAAPTLSNGVVSPASEYQSIDAVERVEVLKGPAAILSGEGGLGGVVNIVYKKPTTTKLFDLSGEAASYDDYKIAADISSALTPDDSISGRFISSWRSEGRNYGGYNGGHEYMLAPSLRYKDAKLDATVGFNYSDFKEPFQPFSPFGYNSTSLLDISGPIGFRNAFFQFKTTNLYGDLTYDIAPWLTFVARGARIGQDNNQQLFAPLFFVAPTQLYGLGEGGTLHNNTTSADTYLRAKFNTGPLRHTLTGGYNLDTQRALQTTYTGGNDGDYIIVNPLGGAPLPDYAGFSTDPMGNENLLTTSQGYYIQDLIEFWRFHAFVADRDNLYINKSTTYLGSNVEKDSKWTPSGGLVFDLTKVLSLYGSYVEGYIPSDALDVNNDRLPPVQSTQYEGGIKVDLNAHKASFTLDGFHLEQKNLGEEVGFGSDGNPRYTLAGGVLSTGIEGELKGEILPGWNLTLSATKSWFTPVVQNAIGPYDATVSLTPLRGTLFTTYTIRNGPLHGLGFGAGVDGQDGARVQDAIAPTAANFEYSQPELATPGYVRGDLTAYYHIGHLDMALGVKNIAGSHDYAPSANPTVVARLPPRVVRLTLTYHIF